MKKLTIYVSILFAISTLSQGSVPKPALVQKPNEWTIETRFTHPQQIVLKNSNGATTRYWYMIVTMTNKTKTDVDFFPKCEIMTDTFQLISGGHGTPDEVFSLIQARHKSKYPFIELLENAGNKLLQGEDNAKDIAIVWPDFDTKARNIKIFVSGLSNELAILQHPTEKTKEDKPVPIFLRKTLELDYQIGGDAAFRSEAKMEFKGKSWIMR